MEDAQKPYMYNRLVLAAINLLKRIVRVAARGLTSRNAGKRISWMDEVTYIVLVVHRSKQEKVSETNNCIVYNK